jgi:hypothetical protein
MEIQELSVKSEAISAPVYEPSRGESVKSLINEFRAKQASDVKEDTNSFTTTEVAETKEVESSEVVAEESAVETKEVEEVVVEEKVVEEKPVEDDLSKRFAKLSRREKELQDKQRDLKIQMDKVTEFERMRTNIKENPLKLAETIGVSIEDLLLAIAGEEKEPEKELSDTEKLRLEIDEIKKAKAKEEEDKVRIKQQEVEAVISNHQSNIKSFIKANSEQYELCNAQEAADIVWELTEQHWTDTGKLLSIQEATSMVESYLETEAKKLLALNKFKPKVEPKPVVKEETKPTPVEEKKTTQGKTLTNSLTGDVGSKTTGVSKSREQLLQEAFKLFK